MVRATKRNTATKKPAKTAKRAPARFGAVSTINTAPVSVGNSVQGTSPRITQTTNGARVVGRDFAFALASTSAAVNGWEIIGQMPITPCVLPSSVLRNFSQMFNKFQVNSVSFHYITSSPTSQAGDVLFYFEKDALAPMCDYTSSSFLPYVLSDSHTIIGPQWTNHSVMLHPTRDWKTTLYGNQTDLNEQCEGVIHFFSKTATTNSPGYLLIDYDISFRELSVNPRAGTLPVARGQGTPICLTSSATSITAGSAAALLWNSGKLISGATSAPITGAITGDIYKCVFAPTSTQLVNTAWSGSVVPSVSNMLQYGGSNRALVTDDGFTCYLAYNAAGSLGLFPTVDAAVANTDAIEWQTSITSLVWSMCAYAYLVRNVTDFTQSSY